MSYKIAVASKDGSSVDLHFGEVEYFYIYEVSDNGDFSFLEKRKIKESTCIEGAPSTCGNNNESSCSKKNNGGCCGVEGSSAKVETISDVRSVVAAKIGFNAIKQFEKKAISAFDVECSVEEALEKITKYFYKLDNHISLKK